MLDIKFIEENKDIVRDAISNKKGENIDLDEVLSLNEKRKELRGRIDDLSRQRKEAADDRDVEKGKSLKEEAQALDTEYEKVKKDFISLMSKIPNIPSIDTPVGRDEGDNVVVREVGEKPEFSFDPKPHWELGEDLGLIDKERAAKIAGARFAYLLGDLALLQFALINFAFKTLGDEDTLKKIAQDAGVDINVKAFVPVIPPVMVKPEILNAMGRLDPAEDKYHIESDDLYLTGSAEHSVGSMHAEEILEESNLPLRYIGYSSAFRREAGTYGKDTKGILRMHQFDKLEMETFCIPGDSFNEQEFLVAIQEHLMKELKIPYQVLLICTGDMGKPDQRQFDINSWMPGQKEYRETHTSDLIGAFQARRLNTRVRRADGSIEFVHMNDATAFAIGRTLIAIMENYQQEDGSILIPEVLQPFMGKSVIEK